MAPFLRITLLTTSLPQCFAFPRGNKMLLHFYKEMVEKNVTQGFIIDEEYVLFFTIHKMNLFKYQGTKTDGMRDIRINNNLII